MNHRFSFLALLIGTSSLFLGNQTSYAATVIITSPGAPPNVAIWNEPANIVSGGFMQISSRQTAIEGSRSDLILSNYRIRSSGPNSLTTKPISAGQYRLPTPSVGSAWHQLQGSVSLLGNIGPTNFARICITDGRLDGRLTLPAPVPAGGYCQTVTKTSDRTLYFYNFRTPTINIDNPREVPPYTRSANYTFMMGPGSVAGSEIRASASHINPFVAIPEPSSSLGIIAISMLGISSTLSQKLKYFKSRKKETTEVE